MGYFINGPAGLIIQEIEPTVSAGRADGIGWDDRGNQERTLHQFAVDIYTLTTVGKIDIPAATCVEIHRIARRQTRGRAIRIIGQGLLHQCIARIYQSSGRIIILNGVLGL